LEQFLDFQTKNGQNDQILEKNHENSWKLAENLLDPKTIYQLFGVNCSKKLVNIHNTVLLFNFIGFIFLLKAL